MIDRRIQSAATDVPFERMPFAEKLRDATTYIYLFRTAGAYGRQAFAIWWEDSTGAARRFVYAADRVVPPIADDFSERVDKRMAASGLSRRDACEQLAEEMFPETMAAVDKMLEEREPVIAEEVEIPAEELRDLLALVEQMGVLGFPHEQHLHHIDGFGNRVFVKTPAGSNHFYDGEWGEGAEASMTEFASILRERSGITSLPDEEVSAEKRPWWKFR